MIAGQGTIGLELAEQVPDVGTVLIPIGGGGLAAGIAIALRALRPEVRIVGVQAAATLPAARLHDRRRDRGQDAGRADDAILERPARRHRRRSTTRRSARRSCCCSSARSSSSRAPARSASRRCWPARSAATGTVVPLLSGGNIDPTLLISVMRHGLSVAGRYLVVRTRLPTGRAS